MVVLHPTIGTTVVSTPNSGAVSFVTGCRDFFLGAGRTRRSSWVLTASGLASGTAPTTVTAVEFPAKSEAAGPVPHLRTRRRRPRRPIHIGPGTVESPLGPTAPAQFTGDFDEIFRTEGIKILKTPVRAPIANAFAERWIGTLRRELLDRTIIWNQRQLQRLVIDYIAHYNAHRPHRSLEQRPPRHTTPDDNTTDHPLPLRLVRTTRCDGLINEYKHAA